MGCLRTVGGRVGPPLNGEFEQLVFRGMLLHPSVDLHVRQGIEYPPLTL